MLISRYVKKLITSLPKGVRRPLVLIGRVAATGLREFIPYPNLEGSLLHLRDKGYEPGFAIDVGAFGGEWTTDFKRIFPTCRVLMVEPQESKAHLLAAVSEKSDGKVTFESALLGASDGELVEFHEAENGSSVFREQGLAWAKISKKPLVRLDSILRRRTENSPIDFLKLDTQGYEMEVLKGAADALERSEFVLLEGSLIPVNEGCPLALEVLNFMASKGFRWLDVCGQWRRPDKILWQLDFLFVREDSRFVPKPTLIGPASSS